MTYFSHDSNARNDEKIIRLRMKHGAAGYGVYFMLLERMREEEEFMCSTDYDMIAFDLRVDAKIIKSIVEDYDLFILTEDRKNFYSESFRNRMHQKNDTTRRCAEAGKKGMQKRWSKDDEDSESHPEPQLPAPSVPHVVVPQQPSPTPVPSVALPSQPPSSPSPSPLAPSPSPPPVSQQPKPALLTFEKFQEWASENAPEILSLRPPTDRQWTKVKILYSKPDDLARACIEIASNPAFLKKWSYFYVALNKWHEQEVRLGIKK